MADTQLLGERSVSASNGTNHLNLTSPGRNLFFPVEKSVI
jgi:hypothetical protein